MRPASSMAHITKGSSYMLFRFVLKFHEETKVCYNFDFFWYLIAELSLLPIEEQAGFQILGLQSEGGCLAATGMSKIKTHVLDN